MSFNTGKREDVIYYSGNWNITGARGSEDNTQIVSVIKNNKAQMRAMKQITSF